MMLLKDIIIVFIIVNFKVILFFYIVGGNGIWNYCNYNLDNFI